MFRYLPSNKMLQLKYTENRLQNTISVVRFYDKGDIHEFNSSRVRSSKSCNFVFWLLNSLK